MQCKSRSPKLSREPKTKTETRERIIFYFLRIEHKYPPPLHMLMYFLLLSLQSGIEPKYIVRMSGNRVQTLLSGQIDGYFETADCFRLNNKFKGKRVVFLPGSNVLQITFKQFDTLSTFSY